MMFRYPDKTYSMRKIFLPILAMMVLAFTACTKEESIEEMPIVEDQNNSWLLHGFTTKNEVIHWLHHLFLIVSTKSEEMVYFLLFE